MPRRLFIRRAGVWLVVGIASLAWGASPMAEPVSQAQVRGAIERSLPAIEASGVDWMQSQKCISCHNVSFMLWSHNLAKSRGIKVDQAKLDQWIEWSAAKSFEKCAATTNPATNPVATRAAIRDAAVDGGGLDTLAQLMLGRADDDLREAPAMPKWVEFVATTPGMIVAWQEDAGEWKASGQLPRQERSGAEADAVATRWAILALASVPESSERVAAIDRGLQWLKGSKESKSNESRVTALLVAHRLGEKAGDEQALLADVLKQQNADGGWAWLEGAPSDAFETGQALYALANARGESTSKAIARGQAYLVRTQQQDGVWPVTGAGITNAKSTPPRLKKVEPIYRQWGSAWAAIGLASTLPEVKPQAAANVR